MKFKLVSKYKPAGDQPEAIEQLEFGLRSGMKKQTLLGSANFFPITPWNILSVITITTSRKRICRIPTPILKKKR